MKKSKLQYIWKVERKSMREKVTTMPNMRMLLRENLPFIRSDVLYRITKQETQWFITNDVVAILDLRTEEERIKTLSAKGGQYPNYRTEKRRDLK